MEIEAIHQLASELYEEFFPKIVGNESDSKKIRAHFTTFNSFSSIISSRQIRMFHAQSMTDTYETREIYRFAQEQLSGLRVLGKNNADIFAGDILDRLDTFIFSCFETTDIDNLDDITMWRMYGSDGYGLCFLVPKEIETLQCMPTLRHIVFGSGNLIYDDTRKKECIKNLIDGIKMLDANGVVWHASRMFFLLCLCSLSCLFKHSKYSTESEWRLFALDLSRFSRIGGSRHDPNVLSFHDDGRSCPRPYLAAQLQNLPPDAFFRSVIVGPSAAKQHVLRLLRHKAPLWEQEECIRASKIPYQGR